MLTGPNGILEGLQPGSVVIDMSSISPVVTARLAKLVAARGASMLDAPVSGGEIGAVNATLSIMVGGDPTVFERVRPVLALMGHADRIIHIGDEPGSGQICKVCNQIAIGGALAGVGEAFAVAAAAGVDRAKVRQALLGGFAASRVLEVHGERILNGNFVPGFRARLFQKDLRIAEETAADEGVAVPVTDIVAGRVNTIVASGGGDMDYSAVGQTTHLAGRMEQLAPPGATLLTRETLQLVQGHVTVRPTGPLLLLRGPSADLRPGLVICSVRRILRFRWELSCWSSAPRSVTSHCAIRD